MDNNKKPTVLLVDDAAQSIQYLAKIVESAGFEPILCTSSSLVIDFIRKEKPDLVLMDVMMPKLDGFELCKILKNDDVTKDIPLIFITGKTNTDDIINGFNLGGVDYITKPFNSAELMVRIRTHIELKISKDSLKKYAEKLEGANAELKMTMEQLDKASKIDFLTGLYNRKYTFERVNLERIRCKRYGRPFSLILADIDYFKNFNDTYGHDCGDYILKTIGKILMDTVRELDVVARWGGEEFLFILPETDLDGAGVLIGRIREAIKGHKFEFEVEKKVDLNVRLTFGVTLDNPSLEIDSVIKIADDAMYEGKKSGRDCVIVRSMPKEQGL